LQLYCHIRIYCPDFATISGRMEAETPCGLVYDTKLPYRARRLRALYGNFPGYQRRFERATGWSRFDSGSCTRGCRQGAADRHSGGFSRALIERGLDYTSVAEIFELRPTGTSEAIIQGMSLGS
jgi:hypothetical protein